MQKEEIFHVLDLAKVYFYLRLKCLNITSKKNELVYVTIYLVFLQTFGGQRQT